MDLSTLLDMLRRAADGESCVVDLTKRKITIGNDYFYDGEFLSLEETIANAIVHYPIWKAQQTSKHACTHPRRACYLESSPPAMASPSYGCSACGRAGLTYSDLG